MDKIKKYIKRFIMAVSISDKYDLTAPELAAMTKYAISEDALDAVSTAFSYGYIKGYRAHKAEQKKGGAA